MVPDWPKSSTPRGITGEPCTEPSQAMAWLDASCTVTIGAAAGGAGDDEAGAVVEGIVQSVEPAADEWVVHGADREQRLAPEVLGQAELGEHREQVHLADAELDMAALRRLFPPEHTAVAR